MAESETEPTEIPASVILNEIQYDKPYRPVVHDRVIIIGDLDVNELHLHTKRVNRRTEVLYEYRDKAELPEDVEKISDECKVVSASIKITNSVFNGKVNFINTLFKGSINFENTTFSGDADFIGAVFCRDANFIGDTFNGHANFNGTKFVNVSFERATFRFYAVWGYATFNGEVNFEEAKFEGDYLSFGEAKFAFLRSEEDACRRAKSVMAKAGNRYWEEYYFYREMVAKRKLNSLEKHNTLKTEKTNIVRRFWRYVSRVLYYEIIELIFIQWIFGYGVHLKRLIGIWVLFSFLTTLGYVAAVIQHIQPGYPGFYLATIHNSMVTIETIIRSLWVIGFLWAIGTVLWGPLLWAMGTFFWAGFIATFVRRYMR